MGKLAQQMNENFARIRQVYIRYIGTILCVLGVCVIVRGDYNETAGLVFGVFGLGNFLVESVLRAPGQAKRWTWQFLGYGASFAMALGFWMLTYQLEHNWDDRFDKKAFLVVSSLYFYIACCVILSLFSLLRQQKIGVPESLGRMLFALLRAVGVFLLLNIIVILLACAINVLLYEFDIWEVETNVQYLLISLVYVPSCLIAISDTSEENTAFTKKFVSFVLMPCVWLAMGILYLYMIKIFAIQEIPNNKIFNICLYVFLFGAPVWTMAYAFLKHQNTIYLKLVKNTKYIYAPFVLLEVYSIGIRISEFGWTESRYAAVLVILVQLVYIFWELCGSWWNKIRKKETKMEYGERYEYLLFVLLGFIFVGLLLPYGNAEYVAYLSQKNRLEKNITDAPYTAGAAYRYLKSNPYGMQYIDQQLSKTEIERLEGEQYQKETEIEWEYVYYHVNLLEEGLPIGTGYSMLYSFNESKQTTIDLEELQHSSIYVKDEAVAEVDLRQCIRYFIEQDTAANEREEAKPYEMQVDADTKMIVTHISFYYTYGRDIKKLNVQGYLLK